MKSSTLCADMRIVSIPIARFRADWYRPRQLQEQTQLAGAKAIFADDEILQMKRKDLLLAVYFLLYVVLKPKLFSMLLSSKSCRKLLSFLFKQDIHATPIQNIDINRYNARDSGRTGSISVTKQANNRVRVRFPHPLGHSCCYTLFIPNIKTQNCVCCFNDVGRVVPYLSHVA